MRKPSSRRRVLRRSSAGRRKAIARGWTHSRHARSAGNRTFSRKSSKRATNACAAALPPVHCVTLTSGASRPRALRGRARSRRRSRRRAGRGGASRARAPPEGRRGSRRTARRASVGAASSRRSAVLRRTPSRAGFCGGGEATTASTSGYSARRRNASSRSCGRTPVSSSAARRGSSSSEQAAIHSRQATCWKSAAS